MNLHWMIGAALIGYVFGSIPFGLILTRAAGLGDLRQIGSGNIGATNVARTGHKGLAICTLLLDLAKGIAAILLITHFYTETMGFITGLFAVIGHVFPVWLRFRGGKGVATTMGVLLALSWPVGIIVLAIWLITFWFFRYSSLAALISIGYSGLAAYMLDNDRTALLALLLALLIIYTHRANIVRLLSGTEHRFGKNAHG